MCVNDRLRRAADTDTDTDAIQALRRYTKEMHIKDMIVISVNQFLCGLFEADSSKVVSFTRFS